MVYFLWDSCVIRGQYPGYDFCTAWTRAGSRCKNRNPVSHPLQKKKKKPARITKFCSGLGWCTALFVPHSICVSLVHQKFIFNLISECVIPVHVPHRTLVHTLSLWYLFDWIDDFFVLLLGGVKEESNKVKLEGWSFPSGIGGSIQYQLPSK